jgi:hypothetical protein
MPSISVLAAGAGTIAILAAWLWFVSRQARLEQTRLVKARLAHLNQPRFGGYEKARVERYLNEIHAGRMTCEEAQHAIATEWIAAYRPIMRGRPFHSQ